MPLLLTNLSKKQRRDHVMTASGSSGLRPLDTTRASSRRTGTAGSCDCARTLLPIRRCADEPTGDHVKSAGESHAAAAAEPGIQEDDCHGHGTIRMLAPSATRVDTYEIHWPRKPYSWWTLLTVMSVAIAVFLFGAWCRARRASPLGAEALLHAPGRLHPRPRSRRPLSRHLLEPIFKTPRRARRCTWPAGSVDLQGFRRTSSRSIAIDPRATR